MLSLGTREVRGRVADHSGRRADQKGDRPGSRQVAADCRQRHRSRARVEPPHRGRAAGLRTIESPRDAAANRPSGDGACGRRVRATPGSRFRAARAARIHPGSFHTPGGPGAAIPGRRDRAIDLGLASPAQRTPASRGQRSDRRSRQASAVNPEQLRSRCLGARVSGAALPSALGQHHAHRAHSSRDSHRRTGNRRGSNVKAPGAWRRLDRVLGIWQRLGAGGVRRVRIARRLREACAERAFR